MNKINRSEHFSSKHKASRARILAALGCIGLAGVIGYAEGRDSQQGVIAQFQTDAKDRDLALTASQKDAKQCKAVLRATIQRKKVLSRWLDFTSGQLKDNELPDGLASDTAMNQCVDVADQYYSKKAENLAALLDMVNPSDIDRILKAMKRGYTKVEHISKDGKHITLADPNFDPENDGGMNSHAFLSLDEPVGEIPEEFSDPSDNIVKTDEELGLEQNLADGNYDDIIDTLDLEQLKPSGGEDLKMHDYFTKLQKNLNSTDDPDLRKEYFCQMFSEMMKAEMEFMKKVEAGEEEVPDSLLGDDPDDPRKSRLTDLYIQAVMKSLGLEDEEECLMHILNKPACNCSNPGQEE